MGVGVGMRVWVRVWVWVWMSVRVVRWVTVEVTGCARVCGCEGCVGTDEWVGGLMGGCACAWAVCTYACRI